MYKLLSFFLFATIISLTSCKKEVYNKYPIVGLWIGTYEATSGHDQDAGPLYYSFDIQSDHTILVQGLGADGNTYYGQGTWSLTGSDFKATITTMNLSQAGVVQNVTAQYHPTNRRLTNGVVASVNVDFTAKFELERTN